MCVFERERERAGREREKEGWRGRETERSYTMLLVLRENIDHL